MPHWIQTRSEAEQRSQVLLIGDTSRLSICRLTRPLKVWVRSGVETRLRVSLCTACLLSMRKTSNFWAVWAKNPLCVSQPRRRKRRRSGMHVGASRSFGTRRIERIGPVPAGTQWIYVGDRGCDIFRFWQRCQELGYDFLTRVAQNRNVLVEEEKEQEDPTAEHLKTLARSLSSQGVKVLTVPAERGRPEREALLNISWSQVTIQPPTDGTALHQMGMKVSVVRVWEPEPPEGVEALEWILVTSVMVNTIEDAWQRVT
jgi:hypothetical protein